MTLDEKLVKEWSAKFGILEKIEEGIAQDPSNPAHIEAYLLGYHNIGKPEEEQNTRVDPVTFKMYHPTYLRYEIGEEQKKSKSNLVEEVSKEYQAALNLVEDKNLLSILEELKPVQGIDKSYEDMQKLHADYWSLSQIEKLKDENAKVEWYIQINGYKGKVAEIVRESYAEHKGAINVRILQVKDEIKGRLAKQFKDADEVKRYIIANVEKIPNTLADRAQAYFAIGKQAR